MATQKFIGKNILIVDDEPALREILREEFEYQGATVSEAANGKSALQHLKTSPCDLVISDIRMPGGDGIGLLRGIQAESLPVSVFLFMSGFSDLTIDEAYDLGAAAVLAKPFELDSILEQAEFNLLPIEERFLETDAGAPAPKAQMTITKTVLKTLEQALADGEISIGRAGLFVRGLGFGSGTTCHFKITFEDKDFSTFEGDGLVRWNRADGQADLPPGIGIEFRTLPSGIREKVIELVRKNKYSQFIPKK